MPVERDCFKIRWTNILYSLKGKDLRMHNNGIKYYDDRSHNRHIEVNINGGLVSSVIYRVKSDAKFNPVYRKIFMATEVEIGSIAILKWRRQSMICEYLHERSLKKEVLSFFKRLHPEIFKNWSPHFNKYLKVDSREVFVECGNIGIQCQFYQVRSRERAAIYDKVEIYNKSKRSRQYW